MMTHGLFLWLLAVSLFQLSHRPETEGGGMMFCVRLTVPMCMLTESVQLCTCISALYQTIWLPFFFFFVRKG